MNIVVFSYNFLPLKDAESWCTARFAGALAHCGHNVRVVTMEHPGSVTPEVMNTLVGDRVKITRVPVRVVRKPLWTRLKYFTFEWEAVNFDACCAAVRAALADMPEAVLVTRSNPIASTIVGWHCRKFAREWVAHLSDPIPIPGRERGWRNTHLHVNHHWMRRTLRDADLISVTCPNAVRAFAAEYGKLVRPEKFIVTPHIGEPVLPGGATAPIADGVVRIVHHGVMCSGRGAPELAAAVRQLNDEGRRCEFVQCGQVDDVAKVFEGDALVRRAERCGSDIEYIPDLKVPLDYCPFISSKFVYRVYDDMPILLFTHPDGISAQLAARYPEAGIFVADNRHPERLMETLRLALDCKRGTIDRTGIRQEFSRQKVVDALVANLSRVR